MGSEWERVTLGDVLTLQRGIDLPLKDRKPGKVPVVASTGIVGFHNESPVKGPGVVIGRSGSIGGGQYIKQDYWPLNTTLWVKDFKGNSPLYCYYLLKSIDFSGMNVGSGVPTLNRNHIHPMLVRKPSYLEQTNIAELLSALDDRITLLRETNKTLEAIAQTIFKSWFIDFDPVRAKMEGRAPAGMDAETAALFPDDLVESELGLIPKGWEVQLLGGLIVPKRGKSITKSKCIDGEIPVVAGGLTPAYFHNQSNVESPVVTISASGANAGFIKMYQQAIWASDCSYISEAQTDTIFFWYCFLKFNQEKVYSMQQGAAQPHIYPSDLMRLKVALPKNDSLSNLFNDFVEILFNRIKLSELSVSDLTSTRNNLLPRLISGKLRVSENETEISTS
jgi:type I restriction enzyme S subunit